MGEALLLIALVGMVVFGLTIAFLEIAFPGIFNEDIPDES